MFENAYDVKFCFTRSVFFLHASSLFYYVVCVPTSSTLHIAITMRDPAKANTKTAFSPHFAYV